MLVVAIATQAQGIKNGSTWNIGNLDYTARVNADKTVTFTAMAEGEELAFRLTPNRGKKSEYTLGEDPDGTLTFFNIQRATLIDEQGWKLICLYDHKKLLQDVLDGTQNANGEKVAMNKWMQQIMGYYTDSNGDTLRIAFEAIYRRGEVCATYKNIDFNGSVTGILEISGLPSLAGTWDAVQTLDGLTLYSVQPDEYGIYLRTGDQRVLTWVNTQPRFDYASVLLLNDGRINMLDKSTLRIMRNEIFCHHGYMPSAPDLVEYFGRQPWYSPRPSNDDVYDELSLIEKLNIELIKAEEANKDEEEALQRM